MAARRWAEPARVTAFVKWRQRAGWRQGMSAAIRRWCHPALTAAVQRWWRWAVREAPALAPRALTETSEGESARSRVDQWWIELYAHPGTKFCQRKVVWRELSITAAAGATTSAAWLDRIGWAVVTRPSEEIQQSLNTGSIDGNPIHSAADRGGTGEAEMACHFVRRRVGIELFQSLVSQY